MEKIEQFYKKTGMDKYYEHEMFLKLSNKTKQPPHLIFTGFVLLFIILLFTPIGSFLSTCVCLLYPAYQTFKALETEQTDDDDRLLMFWIVFGFFYFCDQMLSWFFSFVPFYHLFRMALMMYIFLPQFSGCERLYKAVVNPFFNRYQDNIQALLQPFETAAARIVQNLRNKKDQ